MKIEKLPEDWQDFYDETITPEEDIIAGDMLLAFLQELADADEKLYEQFTSNHSAEVHFQRHCIGNHPERRSTRTCVYYDFHNRDRFRVYEENVNSIVRNSPNKIISVYDFDLIIPATRKLYEGNQSLLFEGCCGIRGSSGYVSVGIRSFSNSVTTNYESRSTMDLIILNNSNKTLTMYPVDASYLENKLNNILVERTNIGSKIRLNMRNEVNNDNVV